jgi:hypothetical protein
MSARSRTRIVIAALLMNVFVAAVAGSTAGTGRQIREGAPAVAASTPAGTAVISGAVTSIDSPGQPLRRATVSLVSADLRVPLSTTTDDSGRFIFTGVPAGHYGVVASKAAYVAAYYGSMDPGRGPGVPVAVRDGEHVSDIGLRMARGGVITGTLVLPTGLPADGMTVVATGVETVGGMQRPRLRGGRALTDDRGEYRVYGLPPGDYVVQAQPSGFLSGAVSGARDAPQTTASEVSWARAASQRGLQPNATPDPARGRTMQYAKVYYPGTTDPSSVRLVSLGLEEERGGVDFAMALVPTARVSGVALAPDGAPRQNARISLTLVDTGLDALEGLVPGASVQSGDDGSFELPAVAPGRYRLSIRAEANPAAAPAAAAPAGVRPAVRTMAAAAGSASGPGGELWADQELTINGDDVAGLSLLLRSGMTVSGGVTFDSSSLSPPSGEDLARARVMLVPANVGASRAGAAGDDSTAGAAPVSPDGRFAMSGVVPGRYRIAFAMPGLRVSPAAPGDGWSLLSVMADEVDVADRGLEVTSAANLDGLVATFTDRPAELVGTLTDRAGRPAPGYPIVVFSTNRADWSAGSRRVVVARPATDGAFRLAGLPAGTYYLCAVVSVDDGDLEDSTYLELLAQASVTVTLTDGARTTQDLQLAGG